MPITTPTVKIITPMNNTNRIDISRERQNKSNKIPSFGVRVEVQNETIIDKIKWLGEDFTSAMQRLVSGVTALMTQPFFDLYNKETDEDTRSVSCARTLGKIIAGTATGVLIRHICIRATEIFCKTEETEKERVNKETAKNKKTIAPARTEFKPHEQWLLPKGFEKKSFREIKKYRNAIGTFGAIGIMLITNFVIDAPLTAYLTNIFTRIITNDPQPPVQKKTEGGK